MFQIGSSTTRCQKILTTNLYVYSTTTDDKLKYDRDLGKKATFSFIYNILLVDILREPVVNVNEQRNKNALALLVDQKTNPTVLLYLYVSKHPS